VRISDLVLVRYYVHNCLPIFTKFCKRLRNVVASTPICDTNRVPILEVCGFSFRLFSGSGEHIFQQISIRSHIQIKLAMPTLYSTVNETGNRNRILERCKIRFWLVHWIDPLSIEHNYACCKPRLVPHLSCS